LVGNLETKVKLKALIGQLIKSQTKKAESPFGNPAIFLRPVAFRPCLSAGLALTKVILRNYLN
jgi:hypothetical protein